MSQKQFFDVVPISATGFLPPESNATTTPTATTPGISSGAASTTSPLNTGDVGGGKSGQQVCADCDSLLNIIMKININLKNSEFHTMNISFFQTTIPKAVNSLKVLAELPIIVVLMYQVKQ